MQATQNVYYYHLHCVRWSFVHRHLLNHLQSFVHNPSRQVHYPRLPHTVLQTLTAQLHSHILSYIRDDLRHNQKHSLTYTPLRIPAHRPHHLRPDPHRVTHHSLISLYPLPPLQHHHHHTHCLLHAPPLILPVYNKNKQCT